jgi:hypothetical protein
MSAPSTIVVTATAAPVIEVTPDHEVIIHVGYAPTNNVGNCLASVVGDFVHFAFGGTVIRVPLDQVSP